MTGEQYSTGFGIVWFLTFVVAWGYCWYHYGFLLGFGLGWFPSLILGAICGLIWPLLLLCLIVLIVGVAALVLA